MYYPLVKTLTPRVSSYLPFNNGIIHIMSQNIQGNVIVCLYLNNNRITVAAIGYFSSPVSVCSCLFVPLYPIYKVWDDHIIIINDLNVPKQLICF